MGEHLVMYMDHLVKLDESESSNPVHDAKSIEKKPEMVGPSCSVLVDQKGEETEGEPLLDMAECRICQEENSVRNLETPCGCSGSLKYAHRKCIQHWCNEKGDITCEICHQSYQPNYTAPPGAQPDETSIDIGGRWQISGTPRDLHDPHLFSLTEAEHQLLEAEYDDHNARNASGAAYCRSAALILMALLLLRHATRVTDSDGSGDNEDPSAIFSLFLLRAIGFLLPCYIMVWAISILQQRRQRQEAAALAATQFAFVVQSRPRNGIQFTVASATPAVPAAQERV